MLKVGQKAPDFSLPNQDDINISLKNFMGRKILIWFFTKASTGGCTKEGIGFNDEILNFKKNLIYWSRFKWLHVNLRPFEP